MNQAKTQVIRTWRHFMHDSLYRNSIFMFASTASMSLIGFVFWMAAARLYSVHDVGIATTLISASSLISNLSLLGYNTAIIRYMYKSGDQAKRINTSLTLVLLVALIASIVFVLGIRVFSPALVFIQTAPLVAVLFVLATTATACNVLLDSIYIAFQRAEVVFMKNVMMSLTKLSVLFLFIALGATGIYLSNAISVFVSILIASLYLVLRLEHKLRLHFNKKLAVEMSKFSAQNYAANFIEGISFSFLPLIIINLIGAAAAGYFYIDAMIAGAIYLIPITIAQVVLAHGSRGDSGADKDLGKATKFVLLLLLPIILLIVVSGRMILHIFGASYAQSGYVTLVLLVCASIPASIKLLSNAVSNIEGRARYTVVTNAVVVVSIVLLALSLERFGLEGIGIAWLIGESIGAIFAKWLVRYRVKVGVF